MERLTPILGKTYTNHNGDQYICKSVYGSPHTAQMERVKDGWSLVAHGLCQYEDGTIEWDYSTGGQWTRDPFA